MSPDTMLIVLANMNAKLFISTFIFRKVERQQIREVLIQTSSADPFWTKLWKNTKIGSLLAKLSKNKNGLFFLRLGV